MICLGWRPAEPEDFQVEEVALYPPTGQGDHTFVQVRKRLRSTEELARALAREAGVAARDVGYAGRKDRHAVTTQWFSVPRLDPERALALQIPGAQVLAAARHPHKLRTGQLRANGFRIALPEVPDPVFENATRRLDELGRLGMPNRFGGQRFGRDGDNAERGRQLLARGHSPRDRRQARFLISALQAQVFNAVLESRPGPLGHLERGDVAVVHASGGLFVVEDPEAEAPRARAFEISPTGPIFGLRTTEPRHAVAERERALRIAHGVPEPLVPPRGVPLRGARRALRVRPESPGLERRGRGALLQFRLPPGSYATVLLEELFGTTLDDTAGRSEVS